MFTVLLSSLVLSVHAFSFQAKDLVTHQEVRFPNPDKKATVVLFMSSSCPCSESHEKKISRLYQTYSKDGFEFVAVHANQDETLEEAQAHFKKAQLPFAIVQDEGAKIANELKALKTPHAYIIQKGKIIYEGGVDDSMDAAKSKKEFLETALKEVSQGQSITLAKTRALGCQIKR